MTSSTLPSPVNTVPAALDDAALSAQTHATRIRRSRVGLWVALIVVSAGTVGGAAWAVSAWRATAVQLAGADKYTVEPRTFAVVLKEKGELKAARSTEITCEVQGRSTIISLVAEGHAVKAGDLIVELATDQIQDRIRQEELKEANAITAYEASKTDLDIQRDKNASDIRKAKLDIELKKLALRKYEEGDWTQRLKDADIEIEQAQINLKRRREDYEASKQLVDRTFITKTEFAESDFNFKRAEWDLEKAQKAKEVLEQYTHVANLRQRESDVEEALKEHDRTVKNAGAVEINKTRVAEGKRKELELTQDELAKLRGQKKKCRIVAPTDGIVVYYSGGGGMHFMSSDSQIREGATVYERQIMLTLPDTTEMQVVVRVHEAKTDKLKLGQTVVVRVEGVPDHVFHGTVTKIAAVADTQNRWLNPDLKEYETEISLEPSDVPLKPGVTAFAEIMVTRIENKLAVPVQSVFTKAGRRFVFEAKKRGEIAPVEVQVGAIGTEWAEVSGGLSGGEQILLAFGDEQQRLVPDLPPPPGSRAGSPRKSPSRRAGGHRPGRSPGANHSMKRPAKASMGRGGSTGTRHAAPSSHAKSTTP